MRILYGKVEDLTEEIWREKKDLLTKERNERLQKYRMEADRKRCFGAGLLLWYGFRQYGIEPDQVKIQQTKDGKPYLENYPEVHFNLSHAGNYVAAVFDNEEVGIDIEKNSRYRLNIVKHFFRQEELEYILAGENSLEREKRFGIVWTRKESYIKATGLGMRQNIRSFCVLEPFDDWFFHTLSFGEEYQISVCCRKEKIECEPEWVNLLEIKRGE